ncbi:hypothetical protein GUITHDRAFT_138024 [Guillardia theta CCMP2712]|uniref:Uncharacterized protein n=1 Tax=Guillardia theta (strain CCMP2712) TaxID=905079 RepID=L1JDP6_GUITC|nr:hypothetical protein GUITHDRAFT_138024 [Guillardia theta CCMP2712]EKX46636.1 hypothetical protein GUITHDRAFT_138024 [Guillardia theta CCMP2712]|eukprot:XP_005833616.1 hypothetical protein GUITHDRAFT_138024 [Guillardia theta CCMP2712]
MGAGPCCCALAAVRLSDIKISTLDAKLTDDRRQEMREKFETHQQPLGYGRPRSFAGREQAAQDRAMRVMLTTGIEKKISKEVFANQTAATIPKLRERVPWKRSMLQQPLSYEPLPFREEERVEDVSAQAGEGVAQEYFSVEKFSILMSMNMSKILEEEDFEDSVRKNAFDHALIKSKEEDFEEYDMDAEHKRVPCSCGAGEMRYAKPYRNSSGEFDGRSYVDVDSSRLHTSSSNLSSSNDYDEYGGLNDWESDSTDWNSYVNELLDNQELSVAWRDILHDKQEAVSRALQDLARTKDNAFMIISEKAEVAQHLEEDFKKYVSQARTELRSQLENARVMAKRRRKKELAVKRELTEAKKFAQIQAKTLHHDRSSDMSGSGLRDRGDSYDQETKNAIHKAQMRLFLQQRRLKSARLEMIECLREQQKIQTEMNHLRSLVHRDKKLVESSDLRSTSEREQQRPQSRSQTPAYSKPSTPGHLPSPYSSTRSGAPDRDGMSRIKKNDLTKGGRTRGERTDVHDRSSESLSFDDSDAVDDGADTNSRHDDEADKVQEKKVDKQEQEQVQRTSIEYLSTESCAYHPDLGYVGDGPPTTDAEAAEFARKARDPAAYSEASMKHRRASQHNIEQALKLMEDDGKTVQGPPTSEQESSSQPAGEELANNAGDQDKTSSDPPAKLEAPQVGQDQPTKVEESYLRPVPENDEHAHGSVNWSYWGEKRTLAQLICRDIRLSGFLSPACVNDERTLAKHRGKKKYFASLARAALFIERISRIDKMVREEEEEVVVEGGGGGGGFANVGMTVCGTGMRTDERIDAGKGNEDNSESSEGSK